MLFPTVAKGCVTIQIEVAKAHKVVCLIISKKNTQRGKYKYLRNLRPFIPMQLFYNHTSTFHHALKSNVS